jgi:Adenylosuccinate lyase
MNHNPYNNYMKKYLLSFFIISSGVIFAEDTIENIFKVNYKNQLFMDVEVALAEAQSELGIIPAWAANEISSKANIKFSLHGY